LKKQNFETVYIEDIVLEKWQNLINTMAKLLNVPTALIMRLNKEYLEVYVKNNNEKNPYKVGEKETYLNSGLYCETVIRTQNLLNIPNALKDKKWENNPDVKLNMINYLGFPINLPNNEPFGTICVLDEKERNYSDIEIDIVKQFRDILEDNLKIILLNNEIKRKDDLLIAQAKLLEYEKSINNSFIISRTNKDGDITYVNEEFSKVTGYSKEELIGKNHRLIRHPEQPNYIYEKLWNTILDKKTYKSTTKNLTKDGKTIYLNTTITPILDINGEIKEFIAFRFDVTKEYALYQEKFDLLKESRHIIDSTQEAILIYKNGIFDKCNDSAIYLFKQSQDEFKNKNFLDYVSADSYEKVLEYTTIGFEDSYEVTLEKKDKTTFPALIKDKTFELTNEQTRIITIIDLTEIKKKDFLLMQQSKMAAMGDMIGNIAHQWRQPLSLITTVASGLKIHKELGKLDDKVFNDGINTINNTTKHLANTIDDFRNFFKPNKEKVTFEIEKTISKTLKLVSAQFSNKSIELIQNIEKITIQNYEKELIQVLINILNNAKDALQDKTYEKFIFINIHKNDDKLFIEIKDNAGGIKSDIMQRIFEPYFTTKDDTVGTGIGLYMSDEITKKHLRGVIEVLNEEYDYNGNSYKGAKFTIVLPLNI